MSNVESLQDNVNPNWRNSLREYLETVPTNKRAEFAQRCGTTKGYLELLRYGKACNIELAIALHRETDGKVSMQDMYPTLDWDYLRSVMYAEGAQVNSEAVKDILHKAIDNIKTIPLVASGKLRSKASA